MRSNTTTTRVFALAAAAACAASLSACQSDVPVPEPTAGGGTATAAPSAGTEQPTSTTPTGAAPTGTPTGAAPTGTATAAPSAGAAEAQNIEPITFTDEAVGLTETCDQIITDFKAPSYQTGSDADTTVYLLHCTLDYSGDLSYEDARTAGVLMLSDDTESGHYGFRTYFVDDDMEAAGLNPINDGNHRGMNHVDGWFSFTVAGSDGRVDPLPEGATTLVYERDALTDSGTGKTYEAYSTRSEVTIK